MSILKMRSSVRQRLRLLSLVGIVAALALTVSVVSAGNNPLPNNGSPHGKGITHKQYPIGYTLDGVFRPTFNSYLDNKDGSPNDERPFLVGWVGSGTPANAVSVNPGDEVTFRAFIHNDGGSTGNLGGIGPSVAKNTRLLMSFPTNKEGNSLHVSSYIRANNAIVDEKKKSLKTVSDDIEIKSANGSPVKLTYVPGSAKFLQSNKARKQNGYQAWNLSGDQQQFLFSGDRALVDGNTEITENSGLPIGSDGSFKANKAVGNSQGDSLDFFGCAEFHGYVLFKAKVEQQVTPQVGSLHIVKFLDANENGVRDSGESLMPGVSFTTTGPNSFSNTSVTDSNGEITLTNLTEGDYTVTESVPSGFEPTTANPQTKTVSTGQTAEFTFGNRQVTTPTPTPTPTESPTVSPTPTPTETPTSPPTVTPTPPAPTPPSGGPKGSLPKTGTAGAAAAAMSAVAGSAYLYRRERSALAKAIRKHSVEK